MKGREGGALGDEKENAESDNEMEDYTQKMEIRK